jgi:hypothetical protein
VTEEVSNLVLTVRPGLSTFSEVFCQGATVVIGPAVFTLDERSATYCVTVRPIYRT